jgi:hypothetical protein
MSAREPLTALEAAKDLVASVTARREQLQREGAPSSSIARAFESEARALRVLCECAGLLPVPPDVDDLPPLRLIR